MGIGASDLREPERAPLDRARNLDVLRGVAALGVVGWHAVGAAKGGSLSVPATIWWRLPTHTSAGVYLFFALSGYLVGGMWLRPFLRGGPLPPLGPYAVRRLMRIAPLAWLAVAVSVALTPAPVGSVVVHLAFVQNLVPGQARAIDELMWTLSIEAQFYATIAALAWTARHLGVTRFSRRAVLAGCALAWLVSAPVLLIAQQPFTAGLAGYLALTLIGQAGAFAAGLAVLALEGTPWWAHRTRGAWWLTAGALLWVLASVSTPVAGPAMTPLWALASSALVAGAVRSAPWRWTAPLAGIGVISYALYLGHSFLVPLLVPVSGPPAFAWLAAFLELTIPALGLAVLLWVAVERPFQRLGHRLITWRTPGTAAAAGSATGVAAMLP